MSWDQKVNLFSLSVAVSCPANEPWVLLGPQRVISTPATEGERGTGFGPGG